MIKERSRRRALARRRPLGQAPAATVTATMTGSLTSHQGISILLAALVFATAITIEPAALRSFATTWKSLLAALAAGIIVLPALSWAASRIVAPGSLRDGIMTVGLAPCEIASVATTAMAGGQAALSAGCSSAPP